MRSAARPIDDHPAAPASARNAPAIDLAHLGRQTLGDKALELELLELFDRQAARIAGELLAPDPADGALAERADGALAVRADLAHTLKGSAKAVGAWSVAEAAGAYETAARGGCVTVLAGRAKEIDRCVKEARAMIAGLAES